MVLISRVAICSILFGAAVLLLSCCQLQNSTNQSGLSYHRGLVSTLDPKSVLQKRKQQRKLAEWTTTWCEESTEPPLPYDQCDASDIVYRIPLVGGMTNALKLVLLGAILAFEENRCFFVDESRSHLNTFDKQNHHENGFIQRYFAKIGLSDHHEIVEKALQENRIRSLTWQELWDDTRVRRMYSGATSLESLGYHNWDNHELKKVMMRRMWRPKPGIRQQTCEALQAYDLPDDFLSFSVRRGDKTTEQFSFVSMQHYVEAADEAIANNGYNFGGGHGGSAVRPTVFVATDDCTVLPTLREVRPDWRFVSECDKQHDQGGFALSAMSQWSHEKTDAHFAKFFVELYAMATSKYFIGVAYTNVAWWTFFMRPGRDSFRLLDFPDRQNDILDAW